MGGIALFTGVVGGKACVAAQEFQAKRCTNVEFGEPHLPLQTFQSLPYQDGPPGVNAPPLCTFLGTNVPPVPLARPKVSAQQHPDVRCRCLCAGLYSAQKPQISGSTGLSFKTWTGAYPKLGQHFGAANLNPASNQWNQVGMTEGHLNRADLPVGESTPDITRHSQMDL